MAQIPDSVRVTGLIAPSDDTDTYPSHHAKWGKGGFRTVPDISSPLVGRDNIPADRREVGMVVYVEDSDGGGTPQTYQLVGGITNLDWVIFTVGAGEWTSYGTTPNDFLAPSAGATKKVSIGTVTTPPSAATPFTDPGAQVRIEGGHLEIKGTPAGYGAAGDWDGPHLVMGPYHFWVDAETPGNLRIKSGAPTSANDGDIVGTQS